MKQQAWELVFSEKSFCFPLRASAPRLPGGPAQWCAVASGGRPALGHSAARTAASDYDPMAAGRVSVPDGRGPGPAFRQVRAASVQPPCLRNFAAMLLSRSRNAAPTRSPRRNATPRRPRCLNSVPTPPPYCLTPPHAAASAFGFEKVSGVGESPGGLEEKMAGLEILRVRLVH